MFDELLSFYLSEGMDKQILRKLPYAFVPAVIAYNIQLLWRVHTSPYVFDSVLLIGLLIFVVSSSYFLSSLNEGTKNMFQGLELRAALDKFRGTYEKQISLIGDLPIFQRLKLKGKQTGGAKAPLLKRLKQNLVAYKGIIIAVVSGVSTLVLLALGLFQILIFSRIGTDLSLVIFVLVVFYLFYDISKTRFVEEEEKKEAESKNPLGFDFFDRYAITNSLKRLPAKSRSLLFLVGRLMAPLVYVNVPKFLVDGLLVYHSDNLGTLIARFQEPPQTNCQRYRGQRWNSRSRK